MEWFTGPNGVSFRNYYEIGKLAYLRFIFALPPDPNTRIEQIDEVEQKLRNLLGLEKIAKNVFDDFLTGLMDDPSGVNASFRKFVQSLQETLLDVDDNQIFEDLASTPLDFDDDVSKKLRLKQLIPHSAVV